MSVTRGADQRPGVAYRRPKGHADRVVVESTGGPGLDAGDLPTDGWIEAVHSDDRGRLVEALSDHEVDVVYRLLVDGDRRWIHERGKTMDDSGDVIGYLFASDDRIEQRRELERQRERLEEFTGAVSHDLRNPLSIAVGNVEIARELCSGTVADKLERAHLALERMDALIRDLLALARQGRSVEDPVETDLEVIVEKAWGTVGVEADAELKIHGTLPRIECDRRRLRQVFENLFRNSIEHGSKGEPSTLQLQSTSDDPPTEKGAADGAAANAPVNIAVGTLPDGDGFYVVDDGPGIDPEERGDVFEPGHSNAPAGTGFGLAIVDRIAKAHGWSTGVEEGETGGARFEFTDVDVVDEE